MGLVDCVIKLCHLVAVVGSSCVTPSSSHNSSSSSNNSSKRMKLTVLGGKRKFTQDCRAFEIEATLTWLIAYTLVTNCCNLRKKPKQAKETRQRAFQMLRVLARLACEAQVGDAEIARTRLVRGVFQSIAAVVFKEIQNGKGNWLPVLRLECQMLLEIRCFTAVVSS